MNAKRIILLAALGLIVGAGWQIWRTRADMAELERRLADVHARREKLQSALRTPSSASSPAPTEGKVLANESRPISAQPPEKTSAPPARKPTPGLLDLARDNPHLLDLFVANQRSDMRQRYGPLFQSLQLSADQQEKFKDALAAQVARGGDIGAAAKEKGVSFDDPVIKQLQEMSQKQLESELKTLLGEQGFLAYREFDRSLPVRGFVDGFAIQLATVEPLTAEQAAQLAQALVEASAEFRRGERADPKTLDWRAVDSAAQKFLSPLQFASWQLGVAHNRAGGSRADQELTRIYEAAKARGTQAPTN